MYNWQTRVVVLATAISTSISYLEAKTTTLTSVRTNSVKVVQKPQADAADTKRQSSPGQSTQVDSLPEGKGRDVTVRLCTKCHSANVFVSKRHNLDGWYDVIDQMTGKGMRASDQDIESVARYLAVSFPATSSDTPHKSRNEKPGKPTVVLTGSNMAKIVWSAF